MFNCAGFERFAILDPVALPRGDNILSNDSAFSDTTSLFNSVRIMFIYNSLTHLYSGVLLNRFCFIETRRLQVMKVTLLIVKPGLLQSTGGLLIDRSGSYSGSLRQLNLHSFASFSDYVLLSHHSIFSTKSCYNKYECFYNP
jgi:hypothetical protein